MHRFVTALVFVALAALIWAGLHFAMAPSSNSPVLAGEEREVCSATLSGSNTIGEHLAPALLSVFLSGRGYVVDPPKNMGESHVRLSGVLGRDRCTIDIRSHGSSDAFKDLKANTTLIGMSSRAIKSGEVVELRDAGAGDFAALAAVAEHVIALDGIAIIVHPSNPIKTMSVKDVRRIFLREVTDWSELGGVAGPITLYARDYKSGTFQFFRERVLKDAPQWDTAQASARRFESSSLLVQAVGEDPQAIGFVGAAYVKAAVTALTISAGGKAFAPTPQNVRSEDYPISRRLYLYVRPSTMEENKTVAALVDYVKSDEAYNAVEAQNFVSLSPLSAAPQDVAMQTSAVSTDQPCQAGTAEGEVYRTLTAGARRLDSVIRFLPGSNTVDSLARDDIGRAAPAIEEALRAGSFVRLIGHSDSGGDAEANRRLSRERADSIRAAFEGRGVFGLQVDSAGEKCPIADNATLEGRQINRRVEIWIKGPAE